MKCACNRWGPGTTCERPTNTQNAKDLQEKLAKMQSERTEQDTIWKTESAVEKTETLTSKKIHVRDNILYNS